MTQEPARRSRKSSACWIYALFVLGACAPEYPERQLLIDFFRTARLYDQTRIAAFATVTLNPRTEGSVGQFDITDVGREERRPLSDGDRRDERARAAVVDSLTSPGKPDIDLASTSMDIITKPITVRALVRTPDGRTASRTIVVTLQRAVAREQGNVREGRWVIVGLQLE